jgi:hypothetical protein
MNNQTIKEQMFGQAESQDEPCSANNLMIQNNVTTIKPSDLGGDNDYNPGF